MKPFFSSIALIPGPRPNVNPIRPSCSACQPIESRRRFTGICPRGAVSATDVAMQQVPPDLWAVYERRLDQAQVPADQRPDDHKWVRFSSIFATNTDRKSTRLNSSHLGISYA